MLRPSIETTLPHRGQFSVAVDTRFSRPSADQAESQVLTFFIPLFSVGTKYLDSCTACGRVIEVSKEQAETAARQVGPDLR